MLSGRWLVACDLDQTLIYSWRSFRLPAGAREPELAPVESLDGEPVSYMTARAAGTLGRLAGAAVVVPVTTRTNAQYRRVRLGFAPRFAVTANGGHLLVDGVEDEGWSRRLRDRLAAARPLAEVVAVAEKLAGDGWARTVRVADDLFVYLVAHRRDDVPDLREVTAELAGGGWGVSVQGRKVYLVPAALTKETALAEVARRAGTGRLAAAGDSVLDRGMLEAAAVAVRPAHGELHDLGWSPPGLRVTAVAGLLAGEQVLDLLAETVRVDQDPRDAS